jgi:hypothetical protein
MCFIKNEEVREGWWDRGSLAGTFLGHNEAGRTNVSSCTGHYMSATERQVWESH